MAVKLPDPLKQARREAATIKSNPYQFLRAGFERVMADAPYVNPEELLSGIEAFHKERMGKIPSDHTYPEAKPWVEYVLAVDRHLQELAGMSDREMAIYRGLGQYLAFRGYINTEPKMPEQCRVAFIPETDRGPIHIKNVDDPIKFWKPAPKPVKKMPRFDRLVSDGDRKSVV